MNPSPPRRRKGPKWTAALLAPLLLAAAAMVFLLGTTRGASLAAARLAAFEPRLSLRVESGSAWQGLDLRDVSWIDGDFRISLESLAARWRFSLAPRPALRIQRLHAEGLRVAIPPSSPPSPALPWYEALSPTNRQPICLPAIRLPIDLLVRDFSLRRASLDFGGATQRVRSLRFAANLVQSQLEMDSFELDHEQAQLEAYGRIQLSGDYPIELAVRLRSDQWLPPRPFVLRASLAHSIAQLDFTATLDGSIPLAAHGRIHPLDPRLPLRATLAWSNAIAWPLAGPPIASSPAGQLDFDGALDAYAVQLALDLEGPSIPAGSWRIHANGSLREIAFDPIAATLPLGDLSAVGSLSWTNGLACRLDVSSQSNSLHASGTYRDALDFSGTLNVAAPQQLLPALLGNVEGSWSIAGPPAAPSVTLSLGATDLAYSNLARSARARIDASVMRLGLSESHVSLSIDGLDLPERKIAVGSIRAQLDGTRASHRASLSVDAEQGFASLALSGTLEETTLAWTGTLDRAEASAAGVDLALAAPAGLQWLPAASQFVVAPHAWRHARAELRATAPLVLGANGSARLRLDGLELAEFHPLLPSDVRLSGTLSAEASARWSPGALPQFELAADLLQAGIRLAVAEDLFAEEAPPPGIAFETASLRATLADSNLVAQLHLISENLGRAHAEASIAIDPQFALGTWSGNIVLESLQLAVARPFVPSLRTLSGAIDANVALSGNPRRPLLRGTISLTNGLVEPADFPVRLENVHLAGSLQGDRAEWTGGFRSGNGAATLDGEMGLVDDAWTADLRLTGNKLELAYGTLAVLQASPNLRLHVELRRFSLAGAIQIPQAEITLQQLPDSAVSPSPDAVVVDDALPSTSNARPSPPAPPWDRSIDLDLRFGDRIAIAGRGITGRLAGNLRLQQEGQALPRAFGELRIEDGRYRAYGQRLQIRRGQFLFSGPLDRPNLSIEAVRDVPAYDVVAGLRVEGLPSALRTTLFSEPALPDEDILPYLLLGRPLERGESADSNVMLANAAIALGIAGGGGRVASVAERLGVENFQLDTAGEGDSTQVVVSGQVSSRLVLSYGVGVFAPANTLTARYRLARRLYLEAVSGLESSLDLLYYFSF